MGLVSEVARLLKFGFSLSLCCRQAGWLLLITVCIAVNISENQSLIEGVFYINTSMIVR